MLFLTPFLAPPLLLASKVAPFAAIDLAAAAFAPFAGALLFVVKGTSIFIRVVFWDDTLLLVWGYSVLILFS